MGVIPPQDLMFLLMEAREKPAHVGGLQLFEPPEGAPDGLLGELYEHALTSNGQMRSLFTRRPYRPGGFGPWSWETDGRFDLEYHVRHSALPSPGRIRELLALVSRLHGSLLDRNRPLWEVHLIEGLADGRFAMYTKVHHALLDGMSAMRLLVTSMSTDPDERGMPYPWEQRRAEPGASGRTGSGGGGGLLGRVGLADLPGQILGAGMAGVRAALAGLADETAAIPFRAPRSMLNVPVTGARRFAAQSWDLDRVRTAGGAYGATVNDTILAMSAGALRRYLAERDALPDQPLIAMVPVSLKARNGDTSDSGNALGVILCNLGTHLADPVDRLETIQASMARGKARYEGLSPLQILLLSSLAVAPMGPSVLGLGSIDVVQPFLRPPFNVVISNVPGSRDPLYWNGARMVGSYPVSVLVDGQAMNITVTSYDGSIDVGIIGCRRNVPHLQRMLEHLEAELVALEG